VEAEKLKQQGNLFFQQKDFKKALAKYHQANLYLAGLQEKGSAYYSYSKDLQVGEEQVKKMRDLKLSVYLNMAQIYLFESKYQKALDMYNNG
jgi:tetratricopeptide (TPR) repeat protein